MKCENSVCTSGLSASIQVTAAFSKVVNLCARCANPILKGQGPVSIQGKVAKHGSQEGTKARAGQNSSDSKK